MSTLYFKKPPGLYISSGDWNDPANWFDELGVPVDRVPTSSDNVYVIGDVSGTGVAGSVTVGELSAIGGELLSRCDSLSTNEKCCCCALGWGIMICNSNAVTDDDFDVVLNGETIGQHEAKEYSVKGEFWRTDSSITKEALCVPDAGGASDPELCGPNNPSCFPAAAEWPDVTCVPCATSSDMSDKDVDVTLFKQGTNTLEMINTNANYCEKTLPEYEPELCANYGRIWVFEFCKKSDGTVELSKILFSGVYQGYPGANAGPYTFSISAKQQDECVCRPTVYECRQYTGCTATRAPTQRCFETLSECQEQCVKQYFCATYGCVQEPVYSAPEPGKFTTSAACEAVCLERFTCNISSGCSSQGYATVGDTLTQCQSKCQPQSYYCDNGGGCQPLYAAGGQFATLPECTAVCLERAYCNETYGCEWIGYGTTGFLYSNCGTQCQISSYECDAGSGCTGLYGTTRGEFSSEAACAASCLARYQCTDAGGASVYCSFTSYATSGQTEAECNANCQPKSYLCTQWDGCVPSLQTGGFATAGACAAACELNYTCEYYYGGAFCYQTGYQVNAQSFAVCEANCEPLQMRMPITDSGSTVDNVETMLTKLKLPATQTVSNNLNSGVFYAQRERPTPPPYKTLEEQDPTGPGTFLSKTLEKIGIKSSPTCSCKARARIMNDRGNDWCADNVPLIVSWLREEAEKRKLPFIDMAGTLLVKRAISLSRAAKKKQAKNESTATDSADS